MELNWLSCQTINTFLFLYLDDEAPVPGLEVPLQDLLGAVVLGLLPPDEHGDVLLHADDRGQGERGVGDSAHHVHG